MSAVNVRIAILLLLSFDVFCGAASAEETRASGDLGNWRTSVIVFGEVLKPQTMAFYKGVTLRSALMDCGGFTKSADIDQVVLLRQGKAIPCSLAAIAPPSADIPLHPGDCIYVAAKGDRK